MAHSISETRTKGVVAEPEHPPGYRLRRGQNWVFLGLTYASYYLCRYNLDPVAPDLMHDLHIDKDRYGLIKTGRDGAYAIGQMINGLLTDRLGGKRAMTIGAISTIVLNLAFGLAAWSHVAAILPILVLIRSADGYLQAFGAPGMIKINTAWFRRKERGGFAGIFGMMINLGQAGASQLAKLLATGFSIPLFFLALTVPKLDWQYVFIIPPVVTLVVIIAMNFAVKNNPEEAGFHITHDEEEGSPNEQFTLLDVFRKIASNKVVWFVAGAYFCTGFVRGAIVSWWSSYLVDVWHAGKNSHLYDAFSWGLPITATIGSMSSGYISDKLFNGRRAPVAAVLYLAQAGLTLVALLMPHEGGTGSAILAVGVIIAISTMCNSTHSILGTAAAMDLGGRKMAGCSSGIIDSFQYYGSMLSGYGVGAMFKALAPARPVTSASVYAAVPLSPKVWLGAMLPFGLLGAALMGYVWFQNRGKHTLGA